MERLYTFTLWAKTQDGYVRMAEKMELRYPGVSSFEAAHDLAEEFGLEPKDWQGEGRYARPPYIIRCEDNTP